MPRKGDGMSPEECQKLLNVSRETKEKLEIYLSLINKWQKGINLVGKSTLLDPWNRHIYDCGQAVKYILNEKGTILDVGTGAGLPGIVWSIMGVKNIILVDSDEKKTIFLKEVARICEISVEIINLRAENLELIHPKVITTRALAPIFKTFNFLENQININTTFLFFKGVKTHEEIDFAKKYWNENLLKKFYFKPNFFLHKSKASYNSKIVICNFEKIKTGCLYSEK